MLPLTPVRNAFATQNYDGGFFLLGAQAPFTPRSQSMNEKAHPLPLCLLTWQAEQIAIPIGGWSRMNQDIFQLHDLSRLVRLGAEAACTLDSLSCGRK